MIRGYDISQHQSTTPSFDGMGFVVLRATIGTTKDTKYDQHYAAARAAGIVVMAYHFNGPRGSDVEAQAAKFLDVAKDADFLWLDQEAYNATTSGFSDAEAQRFIDAVRKVRPCGLYHSASNFAGVDADAKWVADWRDASEAAGYPRTADGKPFPDWTLWQYDGGGADNLDNDLWNPAKPIAGLLRLGYVTQAEHAAQTEMLMTTAGALLASQQQVQALQQEVVELANELTDVRADLAAAPGIERERIAAAEAERIRGI